MVVVGGNGRTGLDFMKKTFGYDPAVDSYTTPKADGFAWHNYWREDQEDWENVGIVSSLDATCKLYGIGYRPESNHLYQYFSEGMHVSMAGKPIFITEADLQSPCQSSDNDIKSKVNCRMGATTPTGRVTRYCALSTRNSVQAM
jgi:hypothetical protein